VSETTFLQARELCVSYGRSQVLFDVTIAAPRRGAVAVLGRNGAGKTTLLKTIVGELAPHSGSIVLDLHDITRLPTERRIRSGLGYVPQEHSVFGRLSVRENLEVGALSNRDRSAIDQVLALFPKLGQRLGQPAGTLSGGERKMLAIGRALLSNPKLLLLDEPTEGVWIGVIEEISERLRELIKNIAVVIVEQHLELALGLADYAYVLDRGRVALEGRSSAVRKDPRLLRLLAP
jgi:branched-chain amino acid transport system ATP-binding protein